MTTVPNQCLRNQRGINWSELWQAYRVFMPNPAQGILHILEAGRYSRWQRVVITRILTSCTSTYQLIFIRVKI